MLALASIMDLASCLDAIVCQSDPIQPAGWPGSLIDAPSHIIVRRASVSRMIAGPSDPAIDRSNQRRSPLELVKSTVTNAGLPCTPDRTRRPRTQHAIVPKSPFVIEEAIPPARPASIAFR